MSTTAKAAHTAGPWQLAASEFRVVWTKRNADGELLDSGVICDTANNARTRTKENAANARLIAAAPELLSSLQEFMALRQSMIDLGGAKGPLDQQMIQVLAEMQAGVVDRAEAAIQKAKGGQ
jgi:hypothetical protein